MLKRTKAETQNSAKLNAKIRMNMTEGERIKFDEPNASYDFCFSTAISLLGLSLFGFWKIGFLRIEPVAFLMGGLVLLMAGYLEINYNTYPLLMVLAEKYSENDKLQLPADY